MNKFEHYSAKAAESLAAIGAATDARERAHHHRAHAIWRRLIAGIAQAEERAALNPVRAMPSKTRVAGKR